MVELGCQDTDWVGGNDKEVLDAILLREGLILATLGMDKGNTKKQEPKTIFRFSETLATLLGWKRFHKTELTLRVNA